MVATDVLGVTMAFAYISVTIGYSPVYVLSI